MSFYGRFEQIVSWILTLCIAAIIAIALFRLVVTIFQLLVFGALNPLNHEEFEVIFGMIMTLLIAMEFNHSIPASNGAPSPRHTGQDGGTHQHSGARTKIHYPQY